jgi:hypothetical protein
MRLKAVEMEPVPPVPPVQWLAIIFTLVIELMPSSMKIAPPKAAPPPPGAPE